MRIVHSSPAARRLALLPYLSALTLLLSLALLPLRSGATTVVAPEFDSLVSQADYIVHSVVKSVTSEWRITGGQKSIVTHVTLEVRETVTGNPPSALVLEMLGGSVGNETMVVEGAPRFKVGDEDILFIHGNGRQFSPLVAVMHGRYLVRRDGATGAAYVARSNGTPLHHEAEVVLPMNLAPQHAADSRPLTPAEFITRIRASHSRSQGQQKQQ